MRSMSLFLTAAALLAGCSTAPRDVPPNPRAEARLQQLLAGRAAGPALSCLQNRRATDLIRISDETVLVRDGNTIYRNDFGGLGCTNLGNSSYSMVTKSVGSFGMCRGDIVQLVDLGSGFGAGSCAFGDWVPYRRVG